VTSPHLSSLPFLDVDASRGKRTTQHDLNSPADAETLGALVRDTDVFLQALSSAWARRTWVRPRGLRGASSGNRARAYHGLLAWRAWQDIKSVGFLPLRPLHFPENERRWTNDSSTRSCRCTARSNVQGADAYADYVRETSGEDEAAKLPPYRTLPMQALDHAAGYLLAFDIAAALCKTVTVSSHTNLHP